MLGHKLWQTLSAHNETWITLRGGFAACNHAHLFDRNRTVEQVAAQDFDSVTWAIRDVKPDVVINCIGIVKQQLAAKDPVPSIMINALFPHRLAELCNVGGIRLIHMSTDCVFSGQKGGYSEDDLPDPVDLYGRSKLLGEITASGCLTLRTSMIGHELESAYGLLEWFLSQHGKTVRGYKRAIFSGFTTNMLANIIEWIIYKQPQLDGLWHVAAAPIDKFNLLSLIKQVYEVEINIESDDTIIVDRSLNAARFNQSTGFVPPSWQTMIEDMHKDSLSYKGK
jgi:dTDP-4-dehydrorhamnose reductase